MARDRWKSTWEEFGRGDAYYAVLTHDTFRKEQLDDASIEAFFASGEQDVASVLETVRAHVAPGFAPERTVDFGCGVGRLTIPLARASREVVGVDVSSAMLDEARRNCAARGIANASFVPSDDRLSALDGTFDFLHSYITFQHIPPARGEAILRAMLARLAPGGVGALHFTYDRRAPRVRRTVHWMRKRLPLVNGVVNLAQRRSFGAPMMPMHEYRLPRLFAALRDHGCGEAYVRLTDHGGHLGAFLFFQREG
jgi:SAM-dependent methyltransferase